MKDLNFLDWTSLDKIKKFKINKNNKYELSKLQRELCVTMCINGGDGHIPSAFSLIEIITFLYTDILKINNKDLNNPNRDIFILSKGHGCLALYTNLFFKNFITKKDILNFCKKDGLLGEHPDSTKIKGVEACTGSLGHGLSFGAGIALGKKIKNYKGFVYVVIGDGECHEGSVWETANIAKNFKLSNLIYFVDWNQSAMQLLPYDQMVNKWKAFGWETYLINGHRYNELEKTLKKIKKNKTDSPKVIVCKTIKGKGAKMLEGHGMWHHKIPNEQEYMKILNQIKSYKY
jgi:transketolase